MSAPSLAARADDAALLAGLASGVEAAEVAFVRRFQAQVYGLAIAITRERGLAEDVSQETFLRAWRAAAAYDIRKGSVLTWLLSITHNLAVDAVRSRRPVAVDDEVLEALLVGTLGESSEEALVNRLESARVTARLRTLPPEQARAVVLAVIGGCTAAEVSAREEIPLGTAKTRIRTGLKRLRAALAPEEGVHHG
ncbi:RNA polymerase sigma factor [Nocardioides mesophilus]|uniref:Sigma-70 family RNA polymerase sigma factor n=1 Tax=Nocardioides mesophilus TaxID=433659 RepID=A0A7G9R8V7_9ACTN|nr:sigma-70 family RNA polymerase sigma factor [Nocardioides mesophilus]QNN52032.1 sigma-70 family RNA polymerase sigma factor [Nocardioides mesophilus]